MGNPCRWTGRRFKTGGGRAGVYAARTGCLKSRGSGDDGDGKPTIKLVEELRIMASDSLGGLHYYGDVTVEIDDPS